MGASVDPEAVLLEFHRIGAAVKVSAVDPRTLVEVSIVGPASAGEHILTRNVLAKLERAVARRTGRGSQAAVRRGAGDGRHDRTV